MHQQDTRQQIKEGLKAACGVLQVYEASCNESVDDYADLVFSMVRPLILSSRLSGFNSQFGEPRAHLVYNTVDSETCSFQCRRSSTWRTLM